MALSNGKGCRCDDKIQLLTKGSLLDFALHTWKRQKRIGLILFDYLKYLLDELPGKLDDIDYLLPWDVALAEK